MLVTQFVLGWVRFEGGTAASQSCALPRAHSPPYIVFNCLSALFPVKCLLLEWILPAQKMYAYFELLYSTIHICSPWCQRIKWRIFAYSQQFFRFLCMSMSHTYSGMKLVCCLTYATGWPVTYVGLILACY
jgi:hypothetical protein